MNIAKKTLVILTVTFFILSNNSHGNSSLWLTEQMVSLRFDVDNISHQKLITLLPAIDDHNVLLFDVRRPEEYQMSRIKGSIQISPDMSTQNFISQFGEAMKGKELIFYCSVGYRSSDFIQRIETQANEKGVKAMSNLKGGIFRWYNENHRVVNDEGETDEMHPSNESWANLIEKR